MDNRPTTMCPRCGASRISGQVFGLCPRCLGALNFTSDTSASEGAAVGWMEFSREDLEASFPQLEILELLGRGGMGIVYKARQKELGRLVALKLLPPDRVLDPQFADRFRREAQALASLAHSNIVAIYDFGQANGLFYLLMEFVDGVNLRQAMNAGRFTPDQALAIVPPVCEALQFAHEHGVVHRDIKPENLLLDKRGQVKIVDFGIAKMLGQDANVDVTESQPAGTPQYMAPEQRRPGLTDHRADIYSLGVVLYEMLTGELPTGPLQPPSRRIQVDVHIDEIVLRALEASPEMRFGTAAEFRSSIEAVTRRRAAPSAQERMSGSFSALALWGAAWSALCLISLPFLDMAWIGGLGSTVLGWLAVSEIRRSEGQVRGLGLAVFDGVLFPLLIVNSVMVAACAKFTFPLENQRSLAIASSDWPLIVIGLGLLTFLLVVLVDFILVRAVWKYLNRSCKNVEMPARPRSWRSVMGALLVLGGGAVVLGAPVVNEFVDDSRLTTTARNHHHAHKRATQRWSDLKASATEALIALEAAKTTASVTEIDRLTNASQLLRDEVAQAESAVNQVALQKESSERERQALFYLVGSGLIVTGLLVSLWDARRNDRSIADRDIGLPKTGTATLVTPNELASIWNQCFCYRTRGSLTLDEKGLTHSYPGGTKTIPLHAICDVSIGQLPRLMNLAGLRVLSIGYEDDGQTRQVLISPIEGWLEYSQEAVSVWYEAIRKAVVAATGRKPTTTPQEQLGIPHSSRLISTTVLVAASLLVLVLYFKLSQESLRTATPAPSMKVTNRGFPVSSHLSRNHHSVLVVQDDSASTVDYVLYFPGDISTSSSGSRNLADKTWIDEGVVKLRSGRKFAYSRKAISPDELQINGENFDLRQGRVLVLHLDGHSEQVRSFPSLSFARDPEAVGRFVAEEEGRKNGVIGCSIPQVKVPDGTHELSLHFQRQWQKAPRLGIESSLRIVASVSPDPTKRMPKNGLWTTQQKRLVPVDGQFTVTFALPDEIPIARLQEAAATIRRRYENSSGDRLGVWCQTFGEGELNQLAVIAHPDGWECHLFIRALRLDEFNNPIEILTAPSVSDDKDEPATPADPVDAISDLAMKTYDFSFAFVGVGREARLRDEVRLAIEQFVQKVDAETGRTPDARMDAETRLLTLTGPADQHRVISKMVVTLKEKLAQDALSESKP